MRKWATALDAPTSVEGRRERGYSLRVEGHDDFEGDPVVAGEEEVIRGMIGDIDGLSVLDVGIGRYAIPLAEQGALVVGLEPSPRCSRSPRARRVVLRST